MALSTALGGLIGGFGGSKDARTGTGSSSGTSSTSPSYTADQSDLQSSLAASLQKLLGSNFSSQVQPLKTQAADSINTTYSGLGDRMNRFLAGRGFGKSGETGRAQLGIETGRAGALANNESNFAGLQLDQQNKTLQDALGFAFKNPGSTGTTSGTSSYTNPGSGLASSLAGAFAGFNSGVNQFAALGGGG